MKIFLAINEKNQIWPSLNCISTCILLHVELQLILLHVLACYIQHIFILAYFFLPTDCLQPLLNQLTSLWYCILHSFMKQDSTFYGYEIMFLF